ncbi:MAG TPA: histone deacetylase [Verrucomicrobiae bacterium]|nr:histone deacetylase [Verrucomicrobiae bacterium]
MKIICDEKCAGYSSAGHPERPARITKTFERLENQNDLAIEWLAPTQVSDAQILRAHAPEMLARLQIPKDFDPDTPFHEGILDYARASAAAALDAMKSARAGEIVFSLMRPPGHHATHNLSMGFCYLNNIAIAALEALATGTKRIAVFDFDVHHGNGTEDILLNRNGAAFFSVHQSPQYPHTGEEDAGSNCFNYTVEPSAPRETYRATLARALDDLKKFSPDLIGVSAGFDAYERDPLVSGSLTAEDFRWLGAELRAMDVPFFSLLEGGYSRDLPDLILAYLKGINDR